MTYNAKTAIMEVFKNFPNEELTSEDFYKKSQALNIFVPPAFNTHLSQLRKQGKIKRVKRSTYKYVPQISPRIEQIKLTQLSLC